jgi:ribose 5-phosphate isomerase B
MDDNSARDRIRALVRDVLDKALPGELEGGANPGHSSTLTSSTVESSGQTASRFIDTIPPASSQTIPTRDESSKTVITEDDVRGLANGSVLRIAEGARLTPLAADIVSEKRIEIVRRVPRRGSKTSKLIAVGADHGGFKMKEELKTFLHALGHQVHDFGTNSEDPVDYPDLAYAVARSVAEGTADLGIVIDGAGVGSAITANKVPGVRAAACYSVAVARNSREHNDANVLSLGSKTVSSAEMREIVQAWLGTELTEDRHRKRVAKIQAVERQYLC